MRKHVAPSLAFFLGGLAAPLGAPSSGTPRTPSSPACSQEIGLPS